MTPQKMIEKYGDTKAYIFQRGQTVKVKKTGEFVQIIAFSSIGLKPTALTNSGEYYLSSLTI